MTQRSLLSVSMPSKTCSGRVKSGNAVDDEGDGPLSICRHQSFSPLRSDPVGSSRSLNCLRVVEGLRLCSVAAAHTVIVPGLPEARINIGIYARHYRRIEKVSEQTEAGSAQ